MATAAGAAFGLAFLFAPGRGLASAWRRRAAQKWEFAPTMLAIHLLNHERTPEQQEESRIDGLHRHLRWEPQFISEVVKGAQREGLVAARGNELWLTDVGRSRAREALVS